MSEDEKWRYCDDPAELAAAVAAGVEVQRNWGYDWQPGTNNETAEQFAGCTKANCRYRVPASWSWSYEPPAPVTGDDSEPPEVKRRTRREVTDDFVEGTRTIREWVNGGGVHGPALCEELDAWLDYWGGSPPTPAPPPVPPWPGAVLSGLCDEDGEPTWLAQAGQVRGERVRCSRNLSWVPNHGGYGPGVWVEVRAPRAEPVPETERVNVWDALMNERTAIGCDGTPMELRRGQTILYTRVDGGGGRLMYDDASHPEDKRPLVAPDGTVEVLREDGDA